MPAQSSPKKLRVAILGCGFMGTALLSGMLQKVKNTQHDLTFSVTAPSRASLEQLHQQFDAQRGSVDVITTDNVTAARGAQVIILGFQPQQLSQVFSSPELIEAVTGKLVISMLAGVSTAELVNKVRHDPESTTPHRVARVIPSIGAQVNESATLIASDTNLSADDQDLVAWLFELVGSTQLVPENLLNTVTAVSAATHALAVVAVDAIVDASVAEGVARPAAQAVAAQCLRSASTLLQGPMTIESLKESMSVARGITINALLQLDRGHVRAGISDAVRHAVQYAENMS
ncbi:hypothetical protein ABEF95_009633 [Exophiala dermatitidis]